MTQALPRNVATGAFVLLLHAAILAALMFAMQHQAPLPSPRITEIILRKPAPTRLVPHALIGPARTIYGPRIVPPRIEILPELPSASKLEGVGRALFGCSPDILPSLTSEQRARCLHFSFGHWKPPSLRLEAPDENSPFEEVIAKRNAPAVPMDHPCTVQENSSLADKGLPCFSFSGGPATQAIGGK